MLLAQLLLAAVVLLFALVVMAAVQRASVRDNRRPLRNTYHMGRRG